jgi:hypothetical protein
MQTPLVFRAILGLLMDLAIPAALGAFVMAGMRLRSEGGMNFEASGGFLKWLFWGCLLISLPGVSLWLSNEGVPGASQLSIAGATGAQYTQGVEKVTNDFVNNFLIAHVVPLVAASLVFKAILDLSQGYSPLASIIAALFLLGIQGIPTTFYRRDANVAALMIEVNRGLSMDEGTGAKSNRFDETRAAVAQVLARLTQRFL